MFFHSLSRLSVFLCAALFLGAGCGSGSGAGNSASTVAAAPAAPQPADDAPPAAQTGGFDGSKALAHVARLTAIGTRQAGAPGIAKAQDYILAELKSYDCAIDIDDFHADTPAGSLPMKNIVAKIPGARRDIVLLATHYDTKRLDNFVGADDGGSSTGLMLELARILCAQPGKDTVWIAFFDGEEAVNWQWQDPDNRYGSRQMAARMAAAGDLKRIKAFLLADIVGSKDLRIRRESFSTKWLTNLVWDTAKRLGYSKIFVGDSSPIEDDHASFLSRGVPCVDIIDLEIPYWHTTQDTLDKLSARSMAIVGHVFIESVHELERKSR